VADTAESFTGQYLARVINGRAKAKKKRA
jgi:hypothetical protein